MPVVDFGDINDDTTLAEVIEIVAKMQKALDYLMQGGLDSKNAREFGGWSVGNTELQSRNKTVGMSTEETGADDIRFWAGDLKTGAPKFKVTEAGIATLVSAILTSVASGERVVIDSTGLHCYDSSGIERMTIGTTVTKGVKAITGRDASGVEHSVITYDTETVDGASRTGQYITADGGYILIENDGSIRMQTNPIGGNGFRAKAGFSRPEFNQSGTWYEIAKVGASTSTVGTHDHGISSGVKLATTSDGSTVSGFVTWVPSGSHSHTQT